MKAKELLNALSAALTVARKQGSSLPYVLDNEGWAVVRVTVDDLDALDLAAGLKNQVTLQVADPMRPQDYERADRTYVALSATDAMNLQEVIDDLTDVVTLFPEYDVVTWTTTSDGQRDEILEVKATTASVVLT